MTRRDWYLNTFQEMYKHITTQQTQEHFIQNLGIRNTRPHKFHVKLQ